MKFKKGQSGNPAGKKPGTKSRFTSLKEDWLWVHDAVGGRDRLKQWAESSPRNLTLFYQLETKLFPQEVAHSGQINGSHALTIKVVQLKDENGNGNHKEE